MWRAASRSGRCWSPASAGAAHRSAAAASASAAVAQKQLDVLTRRVERVDDTGRMARILPAWFVSRMTEVRAVHPKAMPVILSKPEEWETWLTAPWSEAKTLQRALLDGSLRIVERDGEE